MKRLILERINYLLPIEQLKDVGISGVSIENGLIVKYEFHKFFTSEREILNALNLQITENMLKDKGVRS